MKCHFNYLGFDESDLFKLYNDTIEILADICVDVLREHISTEEALKLADYYSAKLALILFYLKHSDKK